MVMVFAGIGFVFGRKEACSERASPSSIYRCPTVFVALHFQIKRILSLSQCYAAVCIFVNFKHHVNMPA